MLVMGSCVLLNGQVALHFAEPMKNPRYIGVTVNKQASRTDIVKAAMQQVGHAGKARGATITGQSYSMWSNMAQTPLEHELSNSDTHIFCLPKKPAPPVREGPMTVLVYHRSVGPTTTEVFSASASVQLGPPIMLDLPDAGREGYGGYGGVSVAKQISKDLCIRISPFLKPGRLL